MGAAHEAVLALTPGGFGQGLPSKAPHGTSPLMWAVSQFDTNTGAHGARTGAVGMQGGLGAGVGVAGPAGVPTFGASRTSEHAGGPAFAPKKSNKELLDQLTKVRKGVAA
jgi:hypothetical protein